MVVLCERTTQQQLHKKKTEYIVYTVFNCVFVWVHARTLEQQVCEVDNVKYAYYILRIRCDIYIIQIRTGNLAERATHAERHIFQ